MISFHLVIARVSWQREGDRSLPRFLIRATGRQVASRRIRDSARLDTHCGETRDSNHLSRTSFAHFSESLGEHTQSQVWPVAGRKV